MRSRALATLAVGTLCAAMLACSGGHGRRAPAEGGEPGQSPSLGRSLSVKGSDTMVILSQRWAEGFMQEHPGAIIQISGGGSGAGVSALLAGTADVANASRTIAPREREGLRAERGLEAQETRVALDAVAVYVHGTNTIGPLSLSQLSAVYRGAITRWSELGGADRPIVLYSRENNSGTYAYFKDVVLDGADFAPTAQTLPGTAAVIHAVAQDPNGIGYGGIGYARGVRAVPIVARDGTAVSPTLENATSGRYPLSRPLFMVTAGPPSGLAAELIAFAISDAGQALVAQTGFYPLAREVGAPTGTSITAGSSAREP